MSRPLKTPIPKPHPSGQNVSAHAVALLALVLWMGAGTPEAMAQTASTTALAPINVSPSVRPVADAQAVGAEADEEGVDEVQDAPVALPVGVATRGLLALQRSGLAASLVPRPLAGGIADRGLQRYLKSFEHPIPERFQSSVARKPSNP